MGESEKKGDYRRMILRGIVTRELLHAHPH